MEQEELARLCENTQDKDYIIFLINEGWKCRDETDALVRYSRLRKSKENFPPSWKLCLRMYLPNSFITH